MNKKLQMVWTVALVIAEVSVILFWVLGFKGNMDGAFASLVTGGVSAFVALAAKGLLALRQRNGAFC